MADELGFDDVMGGAPNAQSSGSTGAPAELSFGDVVGGTNAGQDDDLPETSGVGAAVRSFVRSALPAAGAGIGMRAGLLGGAALSGGNPVAAGAGAIGGGIGMGYLSSAAEDALVKELGLDKQNYWWNPFSEQYVAADIAQHPGFAAAGGAATAAIPGAMGPAPGSLRAVSAAIMGGMEGGRQIVTGQNNPYEIAAAAAGGALFPNPRGWVSGAEGALSKVQPFRQSQNDIGQKTGFPNRDVTPEGEAIRAAIDPANDVTTTARGVAAENAPPIKAPDVTGNDTGAPMQAREAAKPNDPGRNYSKENVPTTAEPKAGVQITEAPHEDILTAVTEELGEGSSQSVVPEPNEGAGVGTPSPAVPIASGEPVGGEAVPANAVPNGVAGHPNAEAARPVTPAPAPNELPPEQVLPRGNSPIVEKALEALKTSPDFERVRQRISELPPEQADMIASRYLAGAMSKTGQAEGGTQARVPARRPTIEGVEGNITARSLADRTKKENAVKAWNAAYDKYGPSAGPLDPNDKGAAIARATAAVQHAAEQNGGVNPLDAYKIRTKPPQYQWLKAAQALVRKPTPANVKAFQAAHALEGVTGQNIEGELAMKQRPDIEQAEMGAPAQQTQEQPRETFEQLPPWKPGADLAKPEIDAQNNLREWLNGLSDDDYNLLASRYPEGVGREVNTTQDPEELLRNFQDDLADAYKPRAGATTPEIVPAENVPPVSRPVATREDLAPTEPGAAASTGRRIDLNSPEGRALAEKYGNIAAPDRTGRLESEEAAANKNLDTTALSGLWDTARQHAADLLKDEAGSLNVRRIAPWLFGGRANPFSPQASAAVRDIAKELSDWFHRYTNQGRVTDQKLSAMSTLAPTLEGTNGWDQIGRAIENRTVDKLAPDLQKVYVDHIRPLQAWYNDLIETLHTEFPKLIDAPFGGISKDFLPRIRGEEAIYEKPQDDITNYKRQLSTYAPAAQPRDFFALDDGNGSRYIVSAPDENGVATVWRNGKPTSLKLPGFEGKPGETVTINKNGTPTEFTVDHATVPELEANNPNLKYVHNPFFTLSNAVRQLSAVLDTARTLERLKTDPTIQSLSTTDKQEKPAGWRRTQLEQMDLKGSKPVYYDPRIANIMDDFVKPGFGREDQLQYARNVMHTLANTMYFFGSPIHVLNIGTQWATAQGMNWMKPSEYREMIKEGWDSIKSVYTQGGLNNDILKAGGNPMLSTTLLRDGVINQIADKMGVSMIQNPSAWDGLTRATGIDLPTIANEMLKASNKGMWFANDVLYQTLLRSTMRRNPDMTIQDAIKEVETMIPNYREDQGTVAGSRLFQQFLMDPATSWFGRYHVGLWRSAGNMMNNALNGTSQKRAQALGQMVVLAGLTWGLGPLLQMGLQKATGMDNLEIRPRGMATLLDAGQTLLQNPSDFPRAITQAWTPSLISRMLAEIPSNRDMMTGDEIVPPGTSYGRAGVKLADKAARDLIPPYDTLSRLSEQKIAPSPLDVARQFLENSVGLSERSPGYQKFQQQLPKKAVQAEKAGQKRPGGLLESGYNQLTRP